MFHKIGWFIAPILFIWATKITDPELYIIGGTASGGLGALLLMALNHLAWCQTHAKLPTIEWKEVVYAQEGGYQGAHNVWEYYFEPISQQQPKGWDTVHTSFIDPDGKDINQISARLTKKYRRFVHTLVKKYFRVKPYISQKIDAFYKQHFAGKKVIGIHIRGTDKYKEVTPVPFEQFIATANKFSDCQFFIASDEYRLIEQMKSHLKNPVITFNAHRSTNQEPIHFQQIPHKAILGEEMLIEMLLLAKCDFFIHSQSCVSTMVLYFNPDLDHITLTA